MSQNQEIVITSNHLPSPNTSYQTCLHYHPPPQDLKTSNLYESELTLPISPFFMTTPITLHQMTLSLEELHLFMSCLSCMYWSQNQNSYLSITHFVKPLKSLICDQFSNCPHIIQTIKLYSSNMIHMSPLTLSNHHKSSENQPCQNPVHHVFHFFIHLVFNVNSVDLV